MSINRRILLTIFLLASSFVQAFPFFARARTYTIMISPAGDARNTGRIIDNNFERTLTLNSAEKLKEILERDHSNVRVVLSRFPGETVEPLATAHFANRLNVDCFISLHFYQEHATKPNVYVYQFSYCNDFIVKKPELSFYPYDQAHEINQATTQKWAACVKNILDQEEYKKMFLYTGINSMPFAPLIGIKAPALAFEIGLKSADDWALYCKPIIQSIEAFLAL